MAVAERRDCLMYEGGAGLSEPDRFWDMIDRHNSRFLYGADSIPAFMRLGDSGRLVIH